MSEFDPSPEGLAAALAAEIMAIAAEHVPVAVVNAALVGSAGFASGPFRSPFPEVDVSGTAPEPLRPPPLEVVNHGADDLGDLLKLSRVPVLSSHDVHGLVALPHDGVLVATTGRTAVELGLTWGPHVVVIDRIRDVVESTAVAMTMHPDCSPAARDSAVGLVQAAGIDVHVIPDLPGLINARLVATISNLRAGIAAAGTFSGSELDLALSVAHSAPARWTSTLSATQTMSVLNCLREWYDLPRYRPSSAQRRDSLRELTAAPQRW